MGNIERFARGARLFSIGSVGAAFNFIETKRMAEVDFQVYHHYLIEKGLNVMTQGLGLMMGSRELIVKGSRDYRQTERAIKGFKKYMDIKYGLEQQ